jgi:predicted phage terminase large subunit-like protein
MEYEGRGAWQREPHLELLCDKLEDVVSGKIKRLMVFMPPRHGKSEVCSKKFPAWYLAREPDEHIMITSYAADLAYDFSRIARETLRSERELFPDVNVDPLSRSVAHWGIAGHRGGLVAAGVGGPITGRGCKIGFIDDPFKNYEEAASEATRRTVWDWYRTTFRTRLAPDGRIVLIMTRWYEDDLGGKLIEEMEQGTGEKWEILELQGIAGEDDPLGRKPGEALSPRYPINELEAIKQTLGPYHFGALYQQRPRPEEGNYFKVNWMPDIGGIQSLLSKWSRNGSGVHVYAAMDLAIGQKQENDWNVITVGAITPDSEEVLLDVKRFRGDSFEIATEIINTQSEWNPLLWKIEKEKITMAIWPVVVKMMKEKKVTVNAEFDTPLVDLVARARVAQGQMRNGQWLFPHSAPWFDAFQQEMLGFPNTKWDDQVASFSLLAKLMASVDKILDPLDLGRCLN